MHESKVISVIGFGLSAKGSKMSANLVLLLRVEALLVLFLEADASRWLPVTLLAVDSRLKAAWPELS